MRFDHEELFKELAKRSKAQIGNCLVDIEK